MARSSSSSGRILLRLALLLWVAMIAAVGNVASAASSHDPRRGELSALPLHALLAADAMARAQPHATETWLAVARDALNGATALRRKHPQRLFEYLLLGQHALGAAVNAYLSGNDVAATVAARRLLVESLLLVGQNYAARTFSPDDPLPRGSRATPRLLESLDAPPVAEFGAWRVHCDGTRRCTAVLPGDGGATLILTRAAGPGTPLEARLLLRDQDPATPLHLQIGRRWQLLTAMPAGAPHDVPPPLLDALVERIAAEGELRLGDPSQTVGWRLKLTGGAEILRHIDTLQERVGHRSALAQRGRKAESRVPLAPPPRDVRVRLTQITAIDTQLPDDVRDFWAHLCREASMIERLPAGEHARIDHLKLGDDSEIWRLPCRSGAQRMQSVIVFRQDGNLQAVTQPFRHNGMPPRPRLFEQQTLHWLPANTLGPAILPDTAPLLRADAVGDVGLLLFLAREPDQPESCRTAWMWTGRWFESAEVRCAAGTIPDFAIIRDRDRILLEP